MNHPPDTLLSTIGPLTGDGLATLAAALLAAGAAVATYWWQQRHARRDRQAQLYSAALQAVEDYAEAPYRVRRHDNTDTTRLALTTQISDIQSRLAYYRGLLHLHAPRRVASAYETLVDAVRHEAGPQITAAWKTRPVRRDADVPLGPGGRYPRPHTDMAMSDTRRAMRGALR